MRIHDNDDCFRVEALYRLFSRRALCVGGEGAGPCFGDSGGGIFTRRGSTWFLRGVTSFSDTDATGNCDVNTKSVFTAVESFNDWIFNIIDEAQDIQCEFVYEDMYTCKVKNSILRENAASNQLSGSHIRAKKNIDVNALKLHDNRSKFLPVNLGEFFPRLHKYSVLRSEIQTISRNNFKDLWKLEFVEIVHGTLSAVPKDAFSDLVNLNHLDLNNNLIEAIDPDTFVNNIRLDYLSLSSNKIRTIQPMTLRNNLKLTDFRLERNEIKDIHPDTFVHNPNLKLVTLEKNQLRSLNKNMFTNNADIESLALSDNFLQFIDVEVFTPLKKLQNLELRRNTCINENYGVGNWRSWNSISMEEITQKILENCQNKT